MAKRSVAAGVVPPYGIGIGDALSRPDTPIEDLLALDTRRAPSSVHKATSSSR